jgi:hypothetical protein
MGKRSAAGELFLGNMGSIQRETRPSMQREDQLTMETKLEQIAVKAVNQLPKSVVREIRTLRSVGTGGGRLPPVTRWAAGNSRPYREPGPLATSVAGLAEVARLRQSRLNLLTASITARDPKADFARRESMQLDCARPVVPYMN